MCVGMRKWTVCQQHNHHTHSAVLYICVWGGGNVGLYKFMICFCTNLWRQYTFADCNHDPNEATYNI